MKRSSMFITVVYAITMLVVPAFSSTVPAGTQLSVRITENLSSANAKVGQAFHGTLEAPITGNGRMTFPKGSQVTGKVVGVHASGRLSDPGVLDLKLVSISDGRSSSALDTQVFHIKGESHTKSNAAKIGGTAAAGTILGAIFGGGKGALIGAGAGAAAGTVAAAATGKKEAKVESEAVLPFVTAGAPAVALAQPPPPVQSVQAPPAPPPPVQEVQADYPEDNQPAYNRRDRDDADDDGEDDRYRREDRDRDDDRYQRDDRYAQSGYDQGRYVQGFSDHDRRIIRGCYSQNYSNLPPGLAKRDGNLPPGLERHLQRDGTLPPGLQRRVRLLPRSCERRLPPVPKGWVRGVLSGRIMLLDAHYRIMDLFVLRGDD
jgi:hypothetical protein